MTNSVKIWTLSTVVCVVFFDFFSLAQQETKKHKKNNIVFIYDITKKIDSEKIKFLDEPIIAIVAYYGTNYSTNCVKQSGHLYCELTMGLGLEYQCSMKQKNLLRKWFGDDEYVTDAIENRNCYITYPGSSNFYELTDLQLSLKSDTVKIKKNIMHYFHGKVDNKTSTDVAVIRKDRVIFLKRTP